MAQTGKTTGNLKLRSGPGLEFEPPLAFLTPDTAVEVLGEQGDWLHVRVAGQEGYVGKKYVEVAGNAETTAPSLKSAAGGIGTIHKPADEQDPPATGGMKKGGTLQPNQGGGQHGKVQNKAEKE